MWLGESATRREKAVLDCLASEPSPLPTAFWPLATPVPKPQVHSERLWHSAAALCAETRLIDFFLLTALSMAEGIYTTIPGEVGSPLALKIQIPNQQEICFSWTQVCPFLLQWNTSFCILKGDKCGLRRRDRCGRESFQSSGSEDPRGLIGKKMSFLHFNVSEFLGILIRSSESRCYYKNAV